MKYYIFLLSQYLCHRFAQTAQERTLEELGFRFVFELS